MDLSLCGRGSLTLEDRTQPVCISRKCQQKVTKWSAGRKPGVFACLHCSRAGMPCFAWTNKDGSAKRKEFRLLPLHPNDRGADSKEFLHGWRISTWVDVEEADELVVA